MRVYSQERANKLGSLLSEIPHNSVSFRLNGSFDRLDTQLNPIQCYLFDSLYYTFISIFISLFLYPFLYFLHNTSLPTVANKRGPSPHSSPAAITPLLQNVSIFPLYHSLPYQPPLYPALFESHFSKYRHVSSQKQFSFDCPCSQATQRLDPLPFRQTSTASSTRHWQAQTDTSRSFKNHLGPMESRVGQSTRPVRAPCRLGQGGARSFVSQLSLRPDEEGREGSYSPGETPSEGAGTRRSSQPCPRRPVPPSLYSLYFRHHISPPRLQTCPP
jgi:hypothetical protein